MSTDEFLAIPKTLLVQHPDGEIKEMVLDEYLKGVVPPEMGLQKPIEALKAQAIASRSYAITTRRHAIDGFDMCTTTHCQAWKPEKRYADADRAVEETAGLVVTHEGKIVATPYFGHCDGRTRNSEEVWSGKVPYCRSVSCICGYAKLYGHGIGMCQRGAAAMAEQGATAEEILKHYYTGAEIAQAEPIPRTGFRRSVVLGQVVDVDGQPRGGLRLILNGPEGPINKGTTSDGRFWFSKLPAGQWELKVKGKPIRYGDLITDGRNALQLQVVAHDLPRLAANTVPLGYPPELIGTLGYEGVPLTITDPAGSELTVLSGSAAEYNPGGFVAPLSDPGTYTLRLFEQSFNFEIGDSGLWVRFDPEPA